MSVKDEYLVNIAKWRKSTKVNRVSALGRTVKQIMDYRITPQHERFAPVAQLWQQLLPVELSSHCTITVIVGGTLNVVVDSPAYGQQLQWISAEIIEQINRQSPKARITKIKFTVR